MEKLMDLHMHSYYSDDGEFSPEELVRQCYEAGIPLTSLPGPAACTEGKLSRRP